MLIPILSYTPWKTNGSHERNIQQLLIPTISIAQIIVSFDEGIKEELLILFQTLKELVVLTKQLMKNHQSWLLQTLKKISILMKDLIENINFNDIENLKNLMKDNKTLSILVILNVVKILWFSWKN